MALRTVVLTLALVLVATVTFASAADEDAGAAAEREMVMDPSTGKMVTAPEYGGTLTFVNRGCKTIMLDSWFGGFGGSTQAGVTEKLGIAKWELERDQFSMLELWNGARGAYERSQLLRFADALTFLSIDEAVWRSSWELATKCRTSGLTIPPTDLLIIAVAQFHHAPIIHFDRHFDLFFSAQN